METCYVRHQITSLCGRKPIKPIKFRIFSNSPPTGWAGIAAGYRTRRLTTGLKGRSLKDRSEPKASIRDVKDAKDATSMSRLENCFSGAGIVRAERNVFDGLDLRDDHVEFCADPAICVTPQNEPVHRQV